MDVINKIFYIEVEPKFMIQDINNIILTKIKDKYTKTCSEKNGYILEIIKLNKILFSGINDCNYNLFFKVNCQTKMLLPKIGKRINCKIDMIFQHGIFSGFKNLKVLVPISNLDKWNFDVSSNSFKKESQQLKVNDLINLEITEIRYENCKYSCIGKLLNN
jgi:DNA-directed RNA polymerase subunit E'/Rpb7